MPPALALLPALLPAAVAGTSIGLEASGALSGGGGGNQAQLLQQQQLQQQQMKQQEEQAFRHFAPDVQERVGGDITNQAFGQILAELQGQPQDIGLAQQTVFGNTNNPGSGLPTTQSGLASGGIAT